MIERMFPELDSVIANQYIEKETNEKRVLVERLSALRTYAEDWLSEHGNLNDFLAPLEISGDCDYSMDLIEINNGVLEMELLKALANPDSYNSYLESLDVKPVENGFAILNSIIPSVYLFVGSINNAHRLLVIGRNKLSNFTNN